MQIALDQLCGLLREVHRAAGAADGALLCCAVAPIERLERIRSLDRCLSFRFSHLQGDLIVSAGCLTAHILAAAVAAKAAAVLTALCGAHSSPGGLFMKQTASLCLPLRCPRGRKGTCPAASPPAQLSTNAPSATSFSPYYRLLQSFLLRLPKASG